MKVNAVFSVLWELSRIVFIHTVVFVLLKMLRNLISVQNSLYANNCRRKQIKKSVQYSLAFIVLQVGTFWTWSYFLLIAIGSRDKKCC